MTCEKVGVIFYDGKETADYRRVTIRQKRLRYQPVSAQHERATALQQSTRPRSCRAVRTAVK